MRAPNEKGPGPLLGVPGNFQPVPTGNENGWRSPIPSCRPMLGNTGKRSAFQRTPLSTKRGSLRDVSPLEELTVRDRFQYEYRRSVFLSLRSSSAVRYVFFHKSQTGKLEVSFRTATFPASSSPT